MIKWNIISFVLNINPNIKLNIINKAIIIKLSFSPSNHPFLFDFLPFMNPDISDAINTIMNSMIVYTL